MMNIAAAAASAAALAAAAAAVSAPHVNIVAWAGILCSGAIESWPFFRDLTFVCKGVLVVSFRAAHDKKWFCLALHQFVTEQFRLSSGYMTDEEMKPRGRVSEDKK